MTFDDEIVGATGPVCHHREQSVDAKKKKKKRKRDEEDQ